MVARLALLVCIVTCGISCASSRSGQAAKKTMPGKIDSAQAGRGPVTVAQRDELTRAYADRYVGQLAAACDALKKDNVDPAQRREAQLLLANGAANVYDIATNPDVFSR